MERSDIIIIGGGPGGYEIAAKLADKGMKVTLIERDRLGGTCLNRGCIPTKCLCATADAALNARTSSALGIDVNGVSVNYERARARMHEVVDGMRNGVQQMLSKVHVINGTASINADGSVQIGSVQLSADKVLIATGSAPARLPIPGAEYAATSDELLQEDLPLPSRITIIGGGVIGVEFASIYAALGTDVTVLEYCKEILPQFDGDIAKRLRISLQSRGIKFVTGANVKSIASDRTVTYETRRGEASVEADMVLMATGRSPVLPDGLHEAGIELNNRGFIEVDERMCTTRPGFYAAGDVTGLCMLAHAASAQARLALCEDSDVDLNIIPSAVFCTPEAAMAGLTVADCERIGIECATARCNYAANGKAQAAGIASTGLVKLVYNPQTRMLLGAHVLGAHASDLVAEAVALMHGMVTIDELATDIVHAHPTLSELLPAAARNASI